MFCGFLSGSEWKMVQGTNHVVRGLCDEDFRRYEDSVTAGVGTLPVIGKGVMNLRNCARSYVLSKIWS